MPLIKEMFPGTRWLNAAQMGQLEDENVLLVFFLLITAPRAAVKMVFLVASEVRREYGGGLLLWVLVLLVSSDCPWALPRLGSNRSMQSNSNQIACKRIMSIL